MKIQEFTDKVRALGPMYDVELKDDEWARTEVTVTRYGVWLYRVSYNSDRVQVNPMFPQVKKGPEDKKARALADKLAKTPDHKKEARYMLRNRRGQYLVRISVESFDSGQHYLMSIAFGPYGSILTPRQMNFQLQFVGLEPVEVD